MHFNREAKYTKGVVCKGLLVIGNLELVIWPSIYKLYKT